jgi:aldehyde dehydrogenase (NAD+)
MRTFDKLYINGEWVAPTGGGKPIEVVEASSESVLATIPEGSAGDIDSAVKAAHEAFEGWSRRSVEDRAGYLGKISEGLAKRADEIAETIARDVGMPIGLSKMIQAGLPTANFGAYAALAREYRFEEQVGSSLIVREPIGVVGCITPWNYPLHQIAAKVAPALAAGCTVVVKPSEIAPINAFILAEIIHAAGLPKGVFNLVTGYGPVVGEALATHPLVDMISFTGSTRAGKRVSELAAQTIKRVALELGGKSANILLDDADFSKAVPAGVGACYLNSGQTCSALTRMLVPRAHQEEVIKLAKQAAEKFTLGEPVAGKGRLGPLISGTQRERVRGYIRKGLEEGARLVTGGAEAPAELPKGYYVKPTVFADVSNKMTIAQEEIFGPVLCIIPYDSEEEAVQIANDSVYGLAGGVWSGDPERAKRIARRMRTGQVEVNGGRYNMQAPFGGYKQSGNGREFGKYGLEEFLEIKSMQL